MLNVNELKSPTQRYRLDYENKIQLVVAKKAEDQGKKGMGKNNQN